MTDKVIQAAQKRLEEYRNGEFTCAYTEHARDRMEQRDLTAVDIEEFVIRRGNVTKAEISERGDDKWEIRYEGEESEYTLIVQAGLRRMAYMTIFKIITVYKK